MSEENKDKLDEIDNAPKTKKEKKDEISRLKTAILEAKAEGENWKNKYYSVYADMDNTRKLLEKDRLDLIKYRSMGFVENILQVLDNFHIALSHQPSDETTKNYLIGFSYIYKQLLNILEEEGVKELPTNVGDKFNADTMHAVDTEYDETKTPNIVTKVYAHGYKLHDRLIRAASVIVTTNVKKVEEEETTKENNEDLN